MDERENYKRTQLPWIVLDPPEGLPIIVAGVGFKVVAHIRADDMEGGECIANAEYIVKACNGYCDLQRRNLAHQKGEAIDATCHVCGKAYYHVDDEPIRCPFCGVDGRPE